MNVVEVNARGALLRSRIPGSDYAVNPFSGCGHGCRYCYMRVIGRERRQGRGWDERIDARVNTPRLLMRELARRPRGRVMLCSGTDPYQPLEARYRLTRACLELLDQARFPVSILTKSALVLRDLDLFREVADLRIGITITTNHDTVRRAFEPGAAAITERLRALRKLHEAGLSPYVFTGPALPMDPDILAAMVAPFASRVYIDRLNYPSLVRGLLQRQGWEYIARDEYVEEIAQAMSRELGRDKVEAVCGWTRLFALTRVRGYPPL